MFPHPEEREARLEGSPAELAEWEKGGYQTLSCALTLPAALEKSMRPA